VIPCLLDLGELIFKLISAILCVLQRTVQLLDTLVIGNLFFQVSDFAFMLFNIRA